MLVRECIGTKVLCALHHGSGLVSHVTGVWLKEILHYSKLCRVCYAFRVWRQSLGTVWMCCCSLCVDLGCWLNPISWPHASRMSWEVFVGKCMNPVASLDQAIVWISRPKWLDSWKKHLSIILTYCSWRFNVIVRHLGICWIVVPQRALYTLG